MRYVEQRDKLAQWVSPVNNAIAAFLYKLNVTPNHLSVAGAALCAAGAGLVVYGEFFWGGVLFGAGSLLDMLDGALARLGGQTSRFGAFLDSTLDRVAEGLMFAAIANYYAAQSQSLMVGIVVVVLMNSFLISYTRARAESLNLDCKVGLVTRPERVTLISVGLILNIIGPVMVVLFFLSTITVLQRVLHVGHQLHDE